MQVVSAVSLAAGLVGAAVAASCALAGTTTLAAGQTRVWEPGAEAVGAAITCAGHGVRTLARVPPAGSDVARAAAGTFGRVTLLLHVAADGSLIAVCA